MKSLKLQAPKIRRQVQWYGVDYTFTRASLDEYNQPKLDEEGSQVYEPFEDSEIRGLFHQTGVTFTLVSGDSAKVQTKPAPSILSLWQPATVLKPQDRVKINSLTYTVVSVLDIGGMGLFAKISLEVGVEDVFI